MFSTTEIWVPPFIIIDTTVLIKFPSVWKCIFFSSFFANYFRVKQDTLKSLLLETELSNRVVICYASLAGFLLQLPPLWTWWTQTRNNSFYHKWKGNRLGFAETDWKTMKKNAWFRWNAMMDWIQITFSYECAWSPLPFTYKGRKKMPFRFWHGVDQEYEILAYCVVFS